MERISKFIANSGYTSRRRADELIKDGKVKVNGEIAVLGMKVNDNDIISIDNEVIKNKKENYVYYLLNKPRSVICSNHDEKGRKTVVDLIDNNIRIYPVGRLDYDTTGAIILTNDGNLTNLLIHPKNEIDKKYLAKIKGIISVNDIKMLEHGIKIDNYVTSKAKVKLKRYDKNTMTSMVEITIHEGHNHQVKKMFEALGYDVIKLSRLSFAGLDVKNLKSGEYRELKVKEVKTLYSLVSKK